MTWGTTFEVQPLAVPVFDVPEHILELLKTANLPLDKDGLLMLQQHHKKQLDYYKETEMELRKLAVKFIVEKPREGTNTVDLGGGYVAKAGISYSYELDADNETIEATLGRIARISNEASFIADRLITWTPKFQLTEYRKLQDDVNSNDSIISGNARAVLKELEAIITVKDKAPTLEIKAPKGK